MAAINVDYKELEASYGDDMLVLVVAAGYLERLLSKPSIERFWKAIIQNLSKIFARSFRRPLWINHLGSRDLPEVSGVSTERAPPLSQSALAGSSAAPGSCRLRPPPPRQGRMHGSFR